MTKASYLKNRTLYLSRIALMVTLSTIFNAFSLPFGVGGGNMLSLALVPSFLAGIYLGPLAGAAVGFLGDFLGAVIAPKGAYLPLIGLASALGGFIPGVVFKINSLKNPLGIIIAAIGVYLICSVGLNTYAVWQAYIKSMTYPQYIAVRALPQALNAVANATITILLAKSKPIADSLR